ncbi:hypothetical protein [uncultured Imperialibacter sp.]|uniref:hypothetical protein n=1 Tax=uncultured Imperialibacter sp. TaxID=1672639 RepID=UPI0030DCB0DD|tara:strand:- start:7413 stop:8138 length:726 start_codon:yes stop_codon:yes gene_type:complete
MIPKILKNSIFEWMQEKGWVEEFDLRFARRIGPGFAENLFDAEIDVIYSHGYDDFYFGMEQANLYSVNAVWCWPSMTAKFGYKHEYGLNVQVDLSYQDNLYERIDGWINDSLRTFIYEKKQPDLWEQHMLKQQAFEIDEMDLDSPEAFRPEEKVFIKDALNRLIAVSKENREFTREQLEILEHRTLYLAEAVDRLNKTDWKGVALGIFLNMATAMYVTPDQGTWLIQQIAILFKTIPKFIL